MCYVRAGLTVLDKNYGFKFLTDKKGVKSSGEATIKFAEELGEEGTIAI